MEVYFIIEFVVYVFVYIECITRRAYKFKADVLTFKCFHVLPSTGVRGLMLAALLAALMSSLTSILNSASAIITLDIWRLFRKKAKEAELMIVGRVTVLLLVTTSILWLPVMERVQGGQFWVYMQSIRSYLIPPWCMLFLLGIFWKRTTEAVGVQHCKKVKNIDNKKSNKRNNQNSKSKRQDYSMK